MEHPTAGCLNASALGSPTSSHASGQATSRDEADRGNKLPHHPIMYMRICTVYIGSTRRDRDRNHNVAT